MNRIEIIGYIGQDAVVKDLGSNQVINFSVAVSESYVSKTTNEKVTTTMWFECAKWGNNTALAQYLKKGTQVFVGGKPVNRGWLNEKGEVQIVNGIQVLQIDLLAGAKTTVTEAKPIETQTNPQQMQPHPNVPATEEHDDLPF